MYCPYNWKRGHALKQWFPIRKIIDEKHRLEEVSFQESRRPNISDLLFLGRRGSWKWVSDPRRGAILPLEDSIPSSSEVN